MSKTAPVIKSTHKIWEALPEAVEQAEGKPDAELARRARVSLRSVAGKTGTVDAQRLSEAERQRSSYAQLLSSAARQASRPLAQRAVASWEARLFSNIASPKVAERKLQGDARTYFTQEREAGRNPATHALKTGGVDFIGVVSDGDGSDVIQRFALFAKSGALLNQGVAHDSPQIFWEH